MSLERMSEEYRLNTAALELRIVQLRRQLGETTRQETRRRLQKRIGLLYTMAGEGRRMAYDIAHYHEKGGAYEKYHLVRRCC